MPSHAQHLAKMRAVRGWLYVVCAMVAVMVVIGGATRLTDSGLSITEWAPISGAVPPLGATEWAEEFAKYRTTTEYRTVNAGMSLAEFKAIYWWEWGHRQGGRVLGLVFALPLAFFWATGRLTPWLKPRLLLLLLMGASQGVIGWWMVRSGLVNRVDVSQYRLAVHLTLASVIFAYALWLARSLIPLRPGGDAGDEIGPAVAWGAAALVGLVLVQIALGGLVAGLDAGLAYNTWPLMDGALVPGDLLPTGRVSDVFESAKSAQFVHRVGAYLLFAVAWIHAVLTWRSSPALRRGAALVALLVSAQALIGIATLVTQVPLGLALAHQLGAIVVLGAAVIHWRAASPRPAVRPLHGTLRTA